MDLKKGVVNIRYDNYKDNLSLGNMRCEGLFPVTHQVI